MKSWKIRFLTAYPRRMIFRVLGIALGCLGFQLTLVLKDGITDHVQTQKRILLGASHIISARQEISKNDLQWIQNHPWVDSWSHGWEYPSMARLRSISKLIQVHAVDSHFPLIGNIQTDQGDSLGSALHKNPNFIFCDQRFFEIFQPKPGENLQIGDRTFVFAGKIRTNLQLNQGFSQLLPSVFIQFDTVAKNGFPLGGTVWDRILIQTQPENENAFLIASEKNFQDPNIQVRSASENAKDNLRPLLLMTDYLGIIGTISFLLIIIAEYFYSQHSFEKSKKDFALLQVLGMRQSTFFILLLIQNLFVLLASCFLCWMAIEGLMPQFERSVKEFLSWNGDLHPSFISFVYLFFILSLGSSLSFIAQWRLFHKISPSEFLSENSTNNSSNQFLHTPLVLLVPAIATMSFYLSKSLKLSIFFVTTILILSLMAPACLLLLKRLFTKINIRSFPVQKAFKKLTRQRFLPSLLLAVFIIFGFFFGLSALARWTIFQQIKNDPSVSTARFLFDIQQEQEEDLRRFLKNNTGELITSNLVRGKIISVNDQPFEKSDIRQALTREEEVEIRFRNRGINLTSRQNLNDSEQIVLGKWFETKKPNQKIPELSIEEKYAQRLGLHLQDKIEFDIQGVSISGIVTSLRKVQWTSFQPNFFIIVQPGFLNDAPQTYVALLKNFETSVLSRFETEWLNQNANISVVDVAEVFSAAQKMVTGAQSAILFMFFLLSLTVILVLVSILTLQSEDLRKEMQLLSFLGVPVWVSRISIFYEYSILLFFGILVVSLSTWGLGYIFINFVLGW